MSRIPGGTGRTELREDGSRRLAIVCGGGRTKQSFKKECDINVIMARFEKTGALSHFARHAPSYGFAPAVTFHESLEIVRRGTEMFMDLPGKVRARFGNDPAQFLEFVQDENNADEMLALGLRVPKTKSELEVLGDRLEGVLKAAPKPAGGTNL